MLHIQLLSSDGLQKVYKILSESLVENEGSGKTSVLLRIKKKYFLNTNWIFLTQNLEIKLWMTLLFVLDHY